MCCGICRKQEQDMNGGVQALKAYMDFKKNFFADNETSELKAILNGVNLTGGDDADDFEMKL